MSEGQKRKEWNVFVSYHREIKWLERMAEEGWFLENISFGMRYTFVRGEPRRVVYDIDHFSLPANPTLEKIQEKEVFMEMAQEMGWKEVTHDEGQVYYFVKDYVPGEINELHNDEESRCYRAEKFRNIITDKAVILLWMIVVVCITDLAVRSLETAAGERFIGWFDWFTVIYSAFVSVYILLLRQLAARVARELSVTRSEWEHVTDTATHKKVYRLILTVRGLNRFLHRQQQAGWMLKDMTPLSYSFEKKEERQKVYAMDSKWLIARRWRERQSFTDKKDWMGLNSDWEIASVNEARQKGWSFVCAFGGRCIIYCGDKSRVQPLNDAKYDRSLRFISMIGQLGAFLLCCGLIGGICGFFAGYFGF